MIRNRVQCAHCGDIIESKHRHDWVACECGKIFVDGGNEYHRWGFHNRFDIIDLTECDDEA